MNIRIDFASGNPFPDGNNLGRVGEKNATTLVVTPPDYMGDNADIVYYRMAFEVGNDFIKSVTRTEIQPKAETISFMLGSAATISKNGKLQLEGYSSDGSVLVKSELLNFELSESAFGVCADKSAKSPISLGVEILNVNEDGTFDLAVYGDMPEKYTGTKSNDLISSVLCVNVTKIAKEQFMSMDVLKSVTGLNNITESGYRAFRDCRSLEEIDLGGTPQSISAEMFYNCEKLKRINIPDSVNKIGTDAFYCCRALEEIVIPEGVPTIWDNTFYGCENLSKAVLPDTLTAIKTYAFYGCDSLIELIIPNGVTEIGDYAFFGCSALVNMKLPEGLTNISNSMLNSCASLKTIEIPDSVVSIGNQAFMNCTALLKVSIPEGVTELHDETFLQCSSLVDVALPQSLVSIAQRAFRACTNLYSIQIPDSVTSIGPYCFYNSGIMNIVLNSIETIAASTFAACKNLKTVNAPKATTINGYAFQDCTALENVTLGSEGNPVTSIIRTAFSRASQGNLNITVYVNDPETGLSGAPWGATFATVQYLQA